MSDLKDEADEPSYEQLGENGNPFSGTPDSSGQPDLDPSTEDEKDRAERHD